MDLTGLRNFRYEAAAVVVSLLLFPLSAWLTVAVLVGTLLSLGAKVLTFQRQQLALQREIATLVRNEQRLKSQAYTDPLTGLANRLLLTDRFRQTAERCKRNRTHFAVLMVDLDAFKAINDTLGHAAGDVVLQTVGHRLLGAVRASDTVARLGGDEFVLLIESFDRPDELVAIGRKLMTIISEPIALPDNHIVNVGGSVGFALYPRHGTEIDDLLHIADKGMYDCKISGLMELQ
jgi:diguanylate cyclase (GGDEF)-like protein